MELHIKLSVTCSFLFINGLKLKTGPFYLIMCSNENSHTLTVGVQFDITILKKRSKLLSKVKWYKLSDPEIPVFNICLADICPLCTGKHA